MHSCREKCGEVYQVVTFPVQVAEQGIGPVLGAISQSGSIVKMLQAHMKAFAPALEEVPQISQALLRDQRRNRPSMQLLDLPNEVLAHIFGFLDGPPPSEARRIQRAIDQGALSSRKRSSWCIRLCRIVTMPTVPSANWRQ